MNSNNNENENSFDEFNAFIDKFDKLETPTRDKVLERMSMKNYIKKVKEIYKNS